MRNDFDWVFHFRITDGNQSAASPPSSSSITMLLLLHGLLELVLAITSVEDAEAMNLLANSSRRDGGDGNNGYLESKIAIVVVALVVAVVVGLQ